MVILCGKSEPNSSARLADFEKKIGAAFPPRIRRFLGEYGGFDVECCEFTAAGQEFYIDDIICISKNSGSNGIITLYDWWAIEDRIIHPNHVPFSGAAGCTDLFAFSISGDEYSSIHFYNMETDEMPECTKLFDNEDEFFDATKLDAAEVRGPRSI